MLPPSWHEDYLRTLHLLEEIAGSHDDFFCPKQTLSEVRTICQEAEAMFEEGKKSYSGSLYIQLSKVLKVLVLSYQLPRGTQTFTVINTCFFKCIRSMKPARICVGVIDY